MKNKSTVVLYHAECSDGFGGAYAAWKKFGDDAAYIPVAHRNPPPRAVEGNDVYLVDFTYPEDVMEDMVKKVHTLTVLDHHDMMKSAAEKATTHVFAQDHSGSVLAWHYFHPGKPVPSLLQHIEDDDLWSFKLDGTRPLLAVVHATPHDFKIWDELAHALEDKQARLELIKRGTIIVEYNDYKIQKYTSLAEEVEFEGYHVRAINAGPMLKSEIGAVLATKYPPFGIVWYYRRGGVSVALRGNGDVDCAVLAKRYGGGGHRNSAGFSFRVSLPFPFTRKRNDEKEE